jgi:microcystin degradation protein MlrC
MKKLISFLAFFFFCFAILAQDVSKAKTLRIAIAGIAIESSTFSPALSHEEAFHARYGEEIFSYYPFFNEELKSQAQWFPTVIGKALPGGTVTKEAYESLVNQTLARLKESLPYDGLFLDIHGAMSVVGLEDPEGDLIIRIRKVIGYKTIISTSMDLHGNVSEQLAKNSDLITCYRMAPHEDAWETKERAVVNLIDRLKSGKGKPKYKAWIPVPILLPGEKTSTRVEPAKSIYAAIPAEISKKGNIDAAIWVGYAWADEPRNHAVVMVTGDNKKQVKKSAEVLAQNFWKARNEFKFVSETGTLDESLEKALKSKKHPFFISDSGDNPTAGGAGDVTWTLKELLARPEFQKENGLSVIYASIPGPDMVKVALEAGIGANVEALVGAEVDNRYAPPIMLQGKVVSIKEGDKNAETEVVIKVGSVNVIVTKKRKPYHYEKDFTNLGLSPRETDIVIVKIGYLVPELYNMRQGWIMALTPGGVNQDLESLEYKNIKRPMFPLDSFLTEPDLHAQFIPSSEK